MVFFCMAFFFCAGGLVSTLGVGGVQGMSENDVMDLDGCFV